MMLQSKFCHVTALCQGLSIAMKFFEKFLQRHFMGAKFLLLYLQILYSIEPEVSEVLPKLAKSYQQPAFARVEQGKGFGCSMATNIFGIDVVKLHQTIIGKGILHG